MTTLIAWVAYTAKIPNALYIVSDSRITWGSYNRRWDAGRKLFVPSEHAHMFGYCGDVVFPSLVLAQVTAAIDQNILFAADLDAEAKQTIVYESIKSSFARRHNVPTPSFSILHAVRTSPWPTSSFALWRIDYQAKDKSWDSSKIQMASRTGVVVSLGSGVPAANVYARRWQGSDVAGTSISIFSAFCDAISSGSDPLSGGAPQIAALYTSLPPRTIGFVSEGKHYLHGLRNCAWEMGWQT